MSSQLWNPGPIVTVSRRSVLGLPNRACVGWSNVRLTTELTWLQSELHAAETLFQCTKAVAGGLRSGHANMMPVAGANCLVHLEASAGVSTVSTCSHRMPHLRCVQCQAKLHTLFGVVQIPGSPKPNCSQRSMQAYAEHLHTMKAQQAQHTASSQSARMA